MTSPFRGLAVCVSITTAMDIHNRAIGTFFPHTVSIAKMPTSPRRRHKPSLVTNLSSNPANDSTYCSSNLLHMSRRA